MKSVDLLAKLSIDVLGATLQLGDRYLMIDKALILADLHLGKTMHFRKAGLPVPAHAREADQVNLMRIINAEKPESVMVLGDLFHSESNGECEELAMITSQFSDIHFELVMGNHDILAPEVYRSMDFETCEQMDLGPFILTHEPLEDVPEGRINMHGHIHPGIRLRGRGRQALSIPCFHLSPTHLCLPSFGMLTGLMKQSPKKKDRVFGIAGGEVMEF